MLKTISKLPKWNGHLYNWYNIRTLEPLIPRYISSVDSGNFIGFLYTVKQFLEEKKYSQYQERIEILIEEIDRIISLDNIKKCVTEKTKVISLAHVTNVIGDIRDIESIGKYCHDNNIIFNVDGAQSVPHMKVDFKNSNIDFLSFSGHKMCGPTGVGVLVGKRELLEKMEPLCYGGGMNNYFEEDNSYELKDIPTRFEAGTPPIAEVIGLGEAIKYLMNIGMDKIREHEKKLKEYFVDKNIEWEN